MIAEHQLELCRFEELGVFPGFGVLAPECRSPSGNVAASERALR